MPRRETPVSKPQTCLSLSSVNQRTTDVELPANEWSLLSGSFPSEIGQQERIFGKRTLAKFADPVKGIAQFWTPYGYAAGLYQFDTSLDFGLWLTPSSKFPSLTLPPDVPFDGGGYTVDEFGGDWGRTVDVSVPNVCIIDFATVQTTHNFCGLIPSPSDAVDDDNGGPAGRGKRCRWELQTDSYALTAFMVEKLQATNDFNVVAATIVPTPPGCANTGTIPAPPSTYIPPSNFAVVFIGPLSAQRINESGYTTVAAPNSCGIVYRLDHAQTANTQKAILDLTSVQPIYVQYASRVAVEVSVYNPDFSLPVLTEVPLDVDWTLGTGNYTNVLINMQNYLPVPPNINNGSGGQRAGSFVLTGNLKVYYNKLVCTNN